MGFLLSNSSPSLVEFLILISQNSLPLLVSNLEFDGNRIHDCIKRELTMFGQGTVAVIVHGTIFSLMLLL